MPVFKDWKEVIKDDEDFEVLRSILLGFSVFRETSKEFKGLVNPTNLLLTIVLMYVNDCLGIPSYRSRVAHAFNLSYVNISYGCSVLRDHGYITYKYKQLLLTDKGRALVRRLITRARELDKTGRKGPGRPSGSKTRKKK